MEKLYKGIHEFRKAFFKEEEELFRGLSHLQSPEVLFITCADSRIDPNLVTQSRPGDIFIIRNIGNVVPPYDAIRDKNSVAAAIEFSVLKLQISDIIICGHSNCGAVKSLYENDDYFAEAPHLHEWLELVRPAADIVSRFYPAIDESEKINAAEKENILLQLNNIQTYPFVRERLESGRLFLHGWYYEIGTGCMYVYNPATDCFDDINIKYKA
ncbi:MAG: carbonic anhydrase [Dissulfurispiraceae bacterium]|nr:carbonic anhydrase [Dissulfurispiraceae bacterium]